MNTAILAILLFGVLVFIHELGHFTVAKLAGVFVERFALGFGPAILKKKWGETEYALCLLPLGGYVKMRGEEVEEGQENPQSDPRSFANQPVWTRIAIAAMGPLSNLILPVLLFTGLFLVGTRVPTNQIGSVIPGYPGELVGLRAGDKILKVANEPTENWNDLTNAIKRRPGQPTQLSVQRGSSTFVLDVTPISEPDLNMFGEMKPVGKLGLDIQPYRPTIGVADPASIAAKAGLRTGDVIVSVNGAPSDHWWQFEQNFTQATLPKKLVVERFKDEKNSETITIDLNEGAATLASSGIDNGELYIRQVQPKSIAEQRGLQAGDKMVALNGKPLDSWFSFRKQIQENSGETLTVGILRNQKPMNIDLIPREVEHKDEFTREKKKTRQLGVISCAMPSEPATQIEQYANPFKAIYRGAEETIDISVTTITGLVKLVSGKLSMNSLGGPISIFYLAGTSYKIGGWASYIRIMAILSITLAIMNFLPIPILDGGHLLFYFIEAIKGSPVHVKIQHMAQQVGLILIISLMALTFYVDINRYFVERIKSLFN